MKDPKPNKIPSARTIAKHFAAGHVVDYPADAILFAVNIYESSMSFDSVAIPKRPTFGEQFWQNLDVLLYLRKRPLPVSKESVFVLSPWEFMSRWSSVRDKSDIDSVTANFILELSKPSIFSLANGSTAQLVSYLAMNDLHSLCRVDVPVRYFNNLQIQCSSAIIEYGIDFTAKGFGHDFDTNVVLLVKAIFG